MKTALFLIISLTLAFCKPEAPSWASIKDKNSSTQNSKTFRIEIHQWSMAMDEILVFSNDSIFGSGYYLSGSHDSIFVNRKPTQAETEKILNTLASFELDSIKPETPIRSIDDGIEFTFIINNGVTTKTTDIYLQKEANLMQLTNVLNTLLPVGNKINYNQHYLENGY